MSLTISPGGSVPTYVSEAFLQNAAASTGNGTSATVDARTQEIYVWIQGASTPSATLILEWSPDGGSTWLAAYAADLLNTALTLVNSVVIASTTAQRFRWSPPPGATNVRTRISVFVSGTITAKYVERRLV